MNKAMLKLTLVAAAVALSLPAPAAQAQELSRDTGVGEAIATQGNIALLLIREELKFATRVKFAAHVRKPALPAPPRIAAQVAAGPQRPKGTKGRA